MKARRSAKRAQSARGHSPKAGLKKPGRESSFPVVGIGASAGGLDAFERLLRDLPARTGMAFVLVQHLDPTHESRLADILRQITKMSIAEARDGTRIEPDQVYVIPPGMNLRIKDKVLRLEPGRTSPARYTPVDFFFSSLAADQKNKAIGVVLSGTGSDGMAGMKAIKAEGGITFAQDAVSAKYFGMPESAIASGAVDFILPPEEIARHLARLRNHPYVWLPRVIEKEPSPGSEPETPINQLLGLLKKSFGVDFSGYKFSTIDRRIRRRMALRSTENLRDYLRLVRQNPGELRALFQDMFIGVTEFFRDPGMFKALATTVYPAVLKKRPADSPIRIWVPGCSTGEEVYSIAISLLEFLGHRANKPAIQIFGTDANEEAIKKARVGGYGTDIAARVSSARLRRFFTKVEGGFQITKAVRDLCVFSRHDIVCDPPFTRLDLLSCRNVLIYLSPSSQQRLIPVLHYSLKPDGFLILGSAETIGDFDELFSLRDRKFKFYVKKAAGTRHRFEVLAGRGPEFALTEPAGKPPFLRSDFDLQKEAADHLILNHYGPPAVLVNDHMDILHFRGHTGPYLEPAPGMASLNVLKMAREGLLDGLRTSLDAARKKNVAVSKEGLRVEFEGRQKIVDVHVVPIKAPGSRERTFLVLFDDVTLGRKIAAKMAVSRQKTSSGTKGNLRVGQLKQELAATKAYLQSLLETQEASNQELRSLNEEILSSNEELQSTTEELETANEELQSANEELNTLNEELQNRDKELTQAQSDIHTLVSSMDLGLLLLDGDLRIRRFTATARSTLKLSDADLGRPLTEIALPVVFPDLKKHIVQAMDTLKPVLAEVQTQDGRRYELQVRPYSGAADHIEGAVVAFTDISELAVMREALREERSKRAGAEEAVRVDQERFQTIADSMPELISYVDTEQRYQFNNKSYERWYGVPVEQYRGRRVREVLGEAIYAIVRPYIEKALAGESTSYEGHIPNDKVGRRYMHIDYIPRKDRRQKVDGFFVVIRDLTELKEAEEKARNLFEVAPGAMLLHDPGGAIVLVNYQAEHIFGYSRQELIGAPVEILIPERFRKAHAGERQAYMRKPVARPMGIGRELYGLRKDGTEFPVEISLSPIETSSGTLVISAVSDLTERKQLAEQTRWAAILQERARMARDVHDTLAQGFTGVILNLQMVEKSGANLPEEVRNRISRAQEVARASLEEARRSIQALSTTVPSLKDLAGSLRELADKASSNTDTRVLFTLRGTPQPLDAAVEEDLLRIAQQATDNAMQHARAAAIQIELAFEATEIRLRIRDDGQGFDVKKAGRSLGLIGMRERAKEIGGKYELESQPGKGTRVEVWLPLRSTVGRKSLP